jgi:hypothetical protein
MKRMIFTLMATAALFSFAKAADEVKMTIAKAAAAPVIDGVADESDPWGSTWVDLGLANANNTTTGMTGKFQVLADQKNIYLVGQFVDATPNNDADAIGNSYERDCQEIFFSMDTVTGDGAYKAGSWQLRIQREAADDASYIDGNSGANTWSVDRMETSANFKWAVSSDASGWSYEMQLPIDTLAAGSAFDGEYLRFELAAADNTTGAASGRSQQIYYNNNTDNQWKDTRTMALVKLAEKIVSGVNTVKTNASYKFDGTTFTAAGNFNVYDVTGKLVLKASNSANLSALKTGVYVVKGNNLSTKIVKR